MIGCQVDFVSISQPDWERYPRDRSFASLALDIEGAARRVLKGVNPQKERARFDRLCQYFETTVLDFKWSVGSGGDDHRFPNASKAKLLTVTLGDSSTGVTQSNFLSVFDILARQRHVRPSYESTESTQCYHSIFPPGEPVDRHSGILDSMVARLTEHDALNAIKEFKIAAELFRVSSQQRRGVVMLVTLLPNRLFIRRDNR